MVPHSLYLHIPFCRHRCGYCDFNTYAGLEDLIPVYGQALKREIEAFSAAAGNHLSVHTIFFGGGTPSLLPISVLQPIIQSIEHHFDLVGQTEITLELNPGTVDQTYFHGLKELGFNRLSMGVQSASPEELRLLEREHSFSHAIQAVKQARLAGFENINLDLIFALPHQTLPSWQNTLQLALGLQPEHLSLYALTVEHGTPLQHMIDRGLFSLPDPDLAADMYNWSQEYLASHGFQQYEISNWAALESNGQPMMSRHNFQYWRNHPYIGLGAGAHGYVHNVRTSNVLTPAAYIERLSHPRACDFPATPASIQTKPVDRPTEMSETMMMGLRLVRDGVSDRYFNQRFGVSLEQAFSQEISELRRSGLLEWHSDDNGRSLRLTSHGRLLGNQVFMRFLN
ncbi:MAG: radical SAM family heme chaperone HemW [Anaerolineae bacterium]|nr:radical SAM family heme chaperone HemW [Anaerolineae bacterium]